MFDVNLLCLILIFVLGILFYRNWVGIFSFFDSVFSFLLLVLFMYLWMCIHEIFHALAYGITETRMENITFGIALEKGVFYCLSKQEIGKRAILFSLITPFFAIGVVTLILGILFSNPLLCFLSIVNISGSSGDLLMFWYILKLDSHLKYKELDDPTVFVLITSSKLDEKKGVGVSLIESGNYPSRKLDIHDKRKMVISRSSFLIFILFFIFLFFVLFLPIVFF